MSKILLIAPTCDGDDVGEAWVAHCWARGLEERHELTLLTYHKRGSRPAAEQLTRARVVEWHEPRGLGRFERLNSLLKPAYYVFYFRARRWIRKALSSGESFDYIFQPVPVAMRYPSPGIGFGVPVLVGPVGGGLSDPPDFDSSARTDPLYVKLRALDRVRLRVDRTLRRTYTEADVVFGIAPYVSELLSGVPVRRFEIMPETGLLDLPTSFGRPPVETQLRLLFVGRLIQSKGLRLLVESLARLEDVNLHLDVIGDGPDRGHCEKRAAELRQTLRISFHGRLPREGVDRFYSSSHVFVFPSYREPGGNVPWEAMSHGLPLIVCDRGGPGAIVDEACGVKIPVKTEQQVVDDLSIAIRGYADDPESVMRMGRAARSCAEANGLWSSRLRNLELIAESL